MRRNETAVLAVRLAAALSSVLTVPAIADTVLPAARCIGVCGSTYATATAIETEGPGDGTGDSYLPFQSSELDYSFELASPSLHAIDVTFSFAEIGFVHTDSTSGLIGEQATASVAVLNSGATLPSVNAHATTQGTTSVVQNVGSIPNPATALLHLQTDTVYTVVLKAYAQATVPSLNSESLAFAVADPSISFDSSLYPDATLFLSAGIDNQVNFPNPVPLPAAAWLMLSGLGGVGAVARKRCAVRR
jgi:hypothetical protein